VIASAIRIAPPEDPSALSAAAQDIDAYDWLALTSSNGAHAFFHELAEQGSDARALGRVRVAAIGPATAAAIASYGVRPDVIAEEHIGEAVADAILARHPEGRDKLRILLARAAVARDALPERLRAAGVQVDVVAAYRTLPPLPEDAARLRTLVREGGVDVVTFTSSSTVEQTLDALGEGAVDALSKLTVAAIGPITRDTAQAHGIRVDVVAETYTTQGLIAALAQHRQERA
jgi:uroporphyrinogen-III synthase